MPVILYVFYVAAGNIGRRLSAGGGFGTFFCDLDDDDVSRRCSERRARRLPAPNIDEGGRR
jgi:hypothetical protein